MKQTITVFYSLLENKLLEVEELDSVDRDLESAMRECLMRGYRVLNYQDRIFS